MTRRNRLVGGSAVQTSGKAVSLGLQAGHFALVARLLAPADFSHYVAALALFAITLALAEFGLLQTTVLELSRRPDAERAVVAAAGRASAALGALAMGLAAVVTLFLLPIGVGTAALLLVPAFALSRVQLPFAGLRQHRLRFGRMAVAEVAGSAAAVLSLGALFLAGIGPGGHRLAAAALTLGLGELVTVLLLATRLPAPSDSGGSVDAAALLRQSVPLGLAQAASFVHLRVDQVLLAAFGLTSGLAAYGVASRSIDGSLALVNGIGVVALPLLSRARGQDRVDVARRVQALLTIAAVGLGTLTFLFAPQLVALLGGARYPSAVWYARLLCPVLVISVLNLGSAQVVIVEGATTALLRIALVAVVLNVGLNLILIPHLGVWGSISSTWASELVVAVLVAGAARRRLPGLAPARRLVGVAAAFSASSFGSLAAWQAWGARGGVPVTLIALAVVAGLVGVNVARLTGRQGRTPRTPLRAGRFQASIEPGPADADRATVDVSIVAYGTEDLIEECVRSVQQLPEVASVVVVDHGDGESAARAGRLGAATIVDPANPGFGAGQNRGAARGRAPYVLLLNPDADVVADGVAAGLRLLADRSGVAAVQGPIVNRVGGLPDRCQGRELGPVHLLGRAFAARRLLELEPVRRVVSRLPGLADTADRVPVAPVEVESLAATALLVRRSAFEEVGGFDESYFLYGEDLDLCNRLRGAGWQLMAVPQLWARHAHGSSSASPWARELVWWEGTMRYAARGWDRRRWSLAMLAAAVRWARLALTQPSGAGRAWRVLVIRPLRERRRRNQASRSKGVLHRSQSSLVA